MEWNNAKQQQPHNNQQVLVRSNGFSNIAVFHKHEKIFRLFNGASYCAENDIVQWMDLLGNYYELPLR